MSDIHESRRKLPLAYFVKHMQLLEQASNGWILKKNQLRIPDHHLLMPIANMVGIVGPFLRSPRPHDIDRLRRCTNSDNRSLRLKNQTVAFL